MNIVFLATLPSQSSTITGRTIPLACEVQKSGHKVQLLTLGDSNGRADDVPIPITRVGPALRDSSQRRRPSLPLILNRLWSGMRALSRSLKKENPDIVILVKPHPQNTYALHVVSCPVVVDADDDERWSSRLSRAERCLTNYIERQATRRAALITVCSPYLAKRYRKELHAKRVELIPTGITPSNAPALDLQEKLNLNPDAKIILYIGSLALSSGHRVDQLLDIWDELAEREHDLHFVLAGDGIDEEKIRKQALQCLRSKQIHFLGRFRKQEAEELARQATLLADPADNSPASKAKSSFRVVLALRTGVPIIGGNNGIRKMLLPPSIHLPFLYDPAKPAELKKKISFGLTDEARQLFRKETKDLWRRWTWERLGAKFVSLLEEIAR